MDQDNTQFYQMQDYDEDEPMQLGDLLEPFDHGEAYDQPYDLNYDNVEYTQQQYDDPEYMGEDYGDSQYGDEAYTEDDYSDLHEEIDVLGRFKVAMGVFDTISVFVGIVAILGLVAILMSLISWLQTDIMHSVLLIQSGLQ